MTVEGHKRVGGGEKKITYPRKRVRLGKGEVRKSRYRGGAEKVPDKREE